MRKTIINIALIIIAGWLTVSCSDFLDRNPNSYTAEGFYKSEEAIKDGVSGVYAATYMEYAIVPHNVKIDYWTPMFLERGQNNTIGAGGAINPDNSDILKWWQFLYEIVARANSVISGSEPYIANLSDLAKQYQAEARVIRAYAYYYLIASFGDVPFFSEPVTIDQYKSTRTSKTEILDFIINDLETAAAYLPWLSSDQGRVNKAAAYGLEARAGLLGGSLNYGGNAKKYFETARDAAKKVIDSGTRSLAKNFGDLFNLAGQEKADVHNEIIWELMYTQAGTKRYHWIAFGQVSRCQGQTGRHPSSLIAETFECKDGLRIDESPLYDPTHPSHNRDPRFEQTLWMHGDTCSVNYGGVRTLVLEAYESTNYWYNADTKTWELRNNDDINSRAAWASFVNSGCGYIAAKYSHEVNENIQNQTCNVILMRYAEILNSYAEAKIELGELDKSVYDAINQVRERAGMPDISADRIGNQDKMRQIVRRERKVEFAMEGLHFVDMRRWCVGDIENMEPSYGAPLADVRYEGMSGCVPNFKTNNRTDLNDVGNHDAFKDKLHVRDANRFWESKFALFPIPQQEINRDTQLTQNEGY
jgi:hypothetical protein